MSFNQFTNLDFNDLRVQIKEYLRANSNFSDFDFEGSNFSVLIDTLAYNSYINAYNTNMAVNESFIDSATLRENVVSLARNIGYVPRSTKSPVARVSFTVDTSGISGGVRTVKLKAGVVALGAVQNGNYIFSIPEDITVTPNSSGIARFTNIEIFEGNLLKKTFTIDDSQIAPKYILPNQNIDTSTIRVETVGSGIENFIPYQNIFEVDSTSRLFLTQEIEDEKYQILFGDGILGKKPENGATLNITYIVTNGSAANGAANFNFSGHLTYIQGNTETTVTSGVSAITTVTPATSGDEIEPIDSIKYLAPRVYSSQYRAVTANDYTALIPFLYPNVDSVTAYGGEELDPPQYGKVFITVKPKNGELIPNVTKDAIKRDLKKYTVAGIKQEFIDLHYLYVEYDSTVSYDPSFIPNASELKSRILSGLASYAKSTDINSFGGRVKYSKLLNIIDKVDTGITSNITNLIMRRNMVPLTNQLANYEICYGNRFHADTEGFNIRSSAFRIEGVDGDVYMTDMPDNGSTEMGTLKLFTFSDNIVKYINTNAGKVYYDKGEIIVYPINIVSTNLLNRIEIEVVPESNDILAKENMYIVLDTTGNSTLTLKEDLMASGSNRSGTIYIPPSSFSSYRKYTR
jgi:hypothetical protein|tara:strand:- start:361 stop:2253 length:1893 start_codon:yes stop_codon:yes gene_type:complete